MADVGDQSARAAVRTVKQRVEDELLARPGVNAVDVREKITNGRRTGRLAIVVSVDQKKPSDALPPDQLIPAEIEGIPTDVVEERIVLHPALAPVPEIAPFVDATKYPTLHGGISMGPCRSVHLVPPAVPTAGDYVFVGTLGTLVTDRATRATMALTNFHVACIDSGYTIGDTMAQPGLVDAGTCPADVFGTLGRAVLSDNVDGALVSINAGVSTDCSIQEIGDVRGQDAATVGMAVRKRGRTTGLTYGSVASTDASVSIDYGDGLGVHVLKNQLRIEVDTSQSAKFSDHGDSGSVVVTSDNKVVGLLFAGNEVPSDPAQSGTVSFVNPIQSVLDELGVDLCVKPLIMVTRPVICGPVVTRPIVCQVQTRPVTCQIVTRPAICQVVTTPSACQVRTIPGCPVVTRACPPVSLACGPRPSEPSFPTAPTGGEMQELYGRPGADVADEAFWLGYYTALEALAQAEQGEQA